MHSVNNTNRKASLLFIISLLIPLMDAPVNAMITKYVTKGNNGHASFSSVLRLQRTGIHIQKRNVTISTIPNLGTKGSKYSGMRISNRTLLPKEMRNIQQKRTITGVEETVVIVGATKVLPVAAVLIKAAVYSVGAFLGWKVYKKASGKEEQERKEEEKRKQHEQDVMELAVHKVNNAVREEYRNFASLYPDRKNDAQSFKEYLDVQGYSYVDVFNESNSVKFKLDVVPQKSAQEYIDHVKDILPTSDDTDPIYIPRSECSVLEQKNMDDFIQAQKAPFKPGENSGFIPPKGWDGQLVRHKPKIGKSKGFGYPDRKGRIWIPSGENGHGGAHWDVQFPDGTHENVFP